MQQHPLGRIDAQPGEQFGIAQRQLDHLAQLLDGIAHAADVVVVDVAAAAARFLELLAQFDLGLLVDVNDTLGHGRDHGQTDLRKGKGRRVEHALDLGRHVAHLGLASRGNQIAGDQRTLEEVALERLGRALQAHLALRRGKDHPLRRTRFGLGDMDVIARTDFGIGALQAIEADNL